MFVVGDFVTLNDGVSIGDLERFGIPWSDALVIYKHLVRDGEYGIVTRVGFGATGTIYDVQLIGITNDVSDSWYYHENMLKYHDGDRFGGARIRGVLRSDELSCEEKLKLLRRFTVSKFKEGDMVVLLQGAKSNGSFTGSEYDSPEGLIEVLKESDIAFDSEFFVVEELDSEGEVGVCADVDGYGDYFYIKPEFLRLANPLEPEKMEATTVPEYKIKLNLPLDVDIEKLVKDSALRMNHTMHSQVFEEMETVTVGNVLEAGEFLGVDLEVLEKVVKLAGRLK